MSIILEKSCKVCLMHGKQVTLESVDQLYFIMSFLYICRVHILYSGIKFFFILMCIGRNNCVSLHMVLKYSIKIHVQDTRTCVPGSFQLIKAQFTDVLSHHSSLLTQTPATFQLRYSFQMNAIISKLGSGNITSVRVVPVSLPLPTAFRTQN